MISPFQKKKNLILTISGIAFLACILPLVLFIADTYRDQESQLTIHNESHSSIVRVLVKIGNHSFTVNNLLPSQSKTIKFTVEGDTDYNITCDLGSGRLQTLTAGYLTRGVAANDDIRVNDQGIILDKPR